MEINKIDYVFVTDHNNTDYKFFEDENILSGIEKNTQDGRLLLLANNLPVISHPHNFDFEHYMWKGEFKKDHLYEFIDPKDVIVWNKLKTALILIKNIIFYPLTRNLTRKWNCLIPIEKWRALYYERAKDLGIIGGLDLHVKFVYQEKSHGVLIPSYIDGFRWLINIVHSKDTIDSKEKIINALKDGNLYLSINQNFIDIWAEDKGGTKLIGEKVSIDGTLFIATDGKKKLVKIFKDNIPIVQTLESYIQFSFSNPGNYWVEVYEYDFRLYNIYFGFRPVIITNSFRVIDE